MGKKKKKKLEGRTRNAHIDSLEPQLAINMLDNIIGDMMSDGRNYTDNSHFLDLRAQRDDIKKKFKKKTKKGK